MTMTKTEHTRYIQSARWKTRAQRFLRSAGARCRACRGRVLLEVHHLSYDHAGAGKEPDEDLMVLCRRHHQLAHTYEKSGMFGRPYTGATLRRATLAMVEDEQKRRQVLGPARPAEWSAPVKGWLRRQWLTLTGRLYR